MTVWMVWCGCADDSVDGLVKMTVWMVWCGCADDSVDGLVWMCG